MLGMLGILIHMDLCRLPAMHDHWSTCPFFNFALVRDCMSEGLFFLIYSRFLRFAPTLGEPEDEDEEVKVDPRQSDKMHHFR